MSAEEYAAERARESAELLGKVRAIAAELPADWQTVETPWDHSVRIVGPGGACFWVRRETYGAQTGRLTFSAGTPEGADYASGDWHGVDTPHMTAAYDRAPAAIARDIVRKLIPGTLARHAEITGRMSRRMTRANIVETTARDLADRMGTTARDGRDGWQADTPDGIGYGHMQPSAYDNDGTDVRVTVELRGISLARARELADLLGGWGADR